MTPKPPSRLDQKSNRTKTHSAPPATQRLFQQNQILRFDPLWVAAKGAAYPATAFDDFEKAKILVPTAGLLEQFHEQAEPMFRQKHLLAQQNAHLTRTRDLLLPRLISGKLAAERAASVR